MQNIEGLVPPRCPLGAGTSMVQNISARPFWFNGNEKANWVEYYNQYRRILCGGSDSGE